MDKIGEQTKSIKSAIAPVVLEPYNPNWSKQFDEEKKKVLRNIGNFIVDIQHIGSTSIPGSIAKPEIDILIGVKDIENYRYCLEPLKKLGYYYYQRFEESVPERRYFRKSNGITPLVHIHMVEVRSNFWRRHLLFRDYLISHPDIAKKYFALKKFLARQYRDDRTRYSDRKAKFIIGLLEKIEKGKA